MKIALTLNWTTYYAEVTPAELDAVNKVLSRARTVTNEGVVDYTPVLEVNAQGPLEYKICVLPENAQIGYKEN